MTLGKCEKQRSSFAWFAERMIPKNGWGAALVLESYFDESGTGDESKHLVVAGYIFEQSRINDFCADWAAVLGNYGLTHFHMVDCAHGNKPFDSLEPNQCVQVQMKMMRLIKKYSVNGFVCCVEKGGEPVDKLYPQLVRQAVAAISSWADTIGYDGKIGYFFEAGCDGQGEANLVLSELSADRRYSGHAFLPKLGNPGPQAADFLAWQYYNYTKKRSKKKLGRLDFRALMRHAHVICDEENRDNAVSSTTRSIAESRSFFETIFYLPSVDEDGARLKITQDSIMFKNTDIGTHLACSACFRILAYDCKPQFLRSKFAHDILLVCPCGATCKVANVVAPLNNFTG